MKSLIRLWVFISGSMVGYCQGPSQADSLRDLLRTPSALEQKDVINTISRLAWEFYQRSQYDSAVLYYNKALAITFPQAVDNWKGNIHVGLGTSYLQMGKTDSSILHYKNALSIFQSLKDEINVAITISNLSLLYKDQGLYEEALAFSLRAAKIFEKQAPSFSLAASYSSIAAILTKSGSRLDALKYSQDATRMFAKLAAQDALAKSYNNLGELFILLHQYDSATANLLRAADIKRQLNDTKGLARTINNLGKVSMLTGNLFVAERQFNESLSIQKQIEDPIGMIEVLNNAGELYLLTDRYKQSAQTLRESESIVRKAGTPEYLRQNLELQVRLAREQRDFAKGMTCLEELLVIRDSLLNEEKNKSMQAMRIRYETGKKEQQITLLEQREEINRAKIRNSLILITTLIIGLGLVGTIGILIYVNLRNARAAKSRIELLLAETRHRIKNNLQTLASIFHLQTRHYTDHAMILEARSSESRVHAMSMLHERFYAAEADHTVNTKTFLSDLVHTLVDVHDSRDKDLTLTVDVQDIELDIDKALALSLIIQELVCNAFKYAFEHEPDPALSVTIQSNGDRVVATVQDNGIGLNESLIGTSQGFSLVDALVAQLDGKIHAQKEHGTTFTIQFPLTQPWKKRLFS